MLLEHGYNLDIQNLLKETGVPKGSFYHYFGSREDFALQVVGLYLGRVHEAVACTIPARIAAPPDAKVQADVHDAERPPRASLTPPDTPPHPHTVTPPPIPSWIGMLLLLILLIWL